MIGDSPCEGKFSSLGPCQCVQIEYFSLHTTAVIFVISFITASGECLAFINTETITGYSSMSIIWPLVFVESDEINAIETKELILKNWPFETIENLRVTNIRIDKIKADKNNRSWCRKWIASSEPKFERHISLWTQSAIFNFTILNINLKSN